MWPDMSHVIISIPIVACVATFQREWATWARPYGPSECDDIIWYLAVIHIAAHVAIQWSPSVHNSAHVVIAFSCQICQFIAAVAHVAKQFVQFHVPVAALVVIQDAHANINAHCSPCGHLRVSRKYLYLLWPVWPHSQDSGPHGLGHMGRPNEMV